jgi:hypothetical protein
MNVYEKVMLGAVKGAKKLKRAVGKNTSVHYVI